MSLLYRECQSGETVGVWFVHVPKTGGTSITANLIENGCKIAFRDLDRVPDRVTSQHLTPSELDKKLPQWKNWPAFAVVRDPWSRTLSEFNYQLREEITHIKDINEWLIHKHDALQHDVCVDDNHIRPQADFVNERVKLFVSVEKAKHYLCRLFFARRLLTWKRRKNLGTYEKISLENLSHHARTLWNSMYARDVKLWHDLTGKQK